MAAQKTKLLGDLSNNRARYQRRTTVAWYKYCSTFGLVVIGLEAMFLKQYRSSAQQKLAGQTMGKGKFKKQQTKRCSTSVLL